jgi:endonuclease III
VINISESAIRDRLVEHGRILLKAPKVQQVELSGDPEADALLNDLRTYPHAFALACLMDRQIRYEKAWLIPHKIAQRMEKRGCGDFSMNNLTKLSLEDITKMMSEPPPPLHRFVNGMSRIFYSAVQRIASEYAGDASGIWAEKPSSAEAVYRFLRFDGAGPKIATMAVNILARDFKIEFADSYSVDISPDVQVCRVFARLGLSSPEPEQVVYKARALYPEFPGIMDSPSWEIGKTWCRPRDPQCKDCYMKDLCPSRAG